MGKVDELRGFKENVILGHLIPGGTGFPMHRYLKLVPLADTISDEEMDELLEEQRRRHAERDGIPTRPLPGEEGEDDEEDLSDPSVTSLVMDDGDTSADGDDNLLSDESAGDIDLLQ